MTKGIGKFHRSSRWFNANELVGTTVHCRQEKGDSRESSGWLTLPNYLKTPVETCEPHTQCVER